MLDVKEIIKDEISIEDVADKLGLDLKKNGNSSQGNCPTGHPSEHGKCFSVKSSENYFRCFSCGIAGDNIKLVEVVKNIEYKEAMEFLIKEFRPDLLEAFNNNGKGRKIKPEEEEKRRLLYIRAGLYEAIFEKGKELLFQEPGKKSLEYLQTARGYSIENIKKMEWIYWPKEESMKEYLYKKFPQVNRKIIQTLPLTGHYGDNFRLAFPYRDRRKVITGFVKRATEPKGLTIKTYDGKIHEKVRFDSTIGTSKEDLFNLWQCRGQKEIVIVEGYPDTLYFQTQGLNNITAIGQGNISKTHISGLESFKVERAIIAFDNDPPDEKGRITGIENTRNAVELFLRETRIKPFVIDPKGYGEGFKDPDELVRTKGINAFKELIEKATPGGEWLVNNLMKKYDINSSLGRERFNGEAVKLVKTFPKENREDFLNMIKLPGMEVRQAMEVGSLPEKKKEYPPLVGFSLKELMTEKFSPLKFLVQDIMPEGFTILAGKPKIGKSLLAVNMSLSIAQGCMTLGKLTTEKQEVAYFALEDNKRRLQKRIIPMLQEQEAPENFTFFSELLPLDNGGLDQINAYLDSHPGTGFIVIDTIGRVKTPKYKGNAYETDTQLYSKIHEIYLKRGVSVMVITHTKKGEEKDCVDSITGSSGGPGVADTALILTKDRLENEAILTIIGRDIDQAQELALRFNDIFLSWEIIGNAEIYKISTERKDIIELLERKGAMQVKDISALTGKTRQNIQNMLIAMEDKGLLIKVNTGIYDIHPMYQKSNFSNVSNFSNDSSVYSVSSVTCVNNSKDIINEGVTLSHEKHSVTFSPIQDKGLTGGDTTDTTVSKNENNLKLFTQDDVIREAKQRYNANLRGLNVILDDKNPINKKAEKKRNEDIEKCKSQMDYEYKGLKQAGVPMTEEELKTGFKVKYLGKQKEKFNSLLRQKNELQEKLKKADPGEKDRDLKTFEITCLGLDRLIEELHPSSVEIRDGFALGRLD